MKKICSKCNKELNLNNFNSKTNRSGKTKTQPYCKACQKEYKAKYYLNNKDKILKQANKRKQDFKKQFYNNTLFKSKCKICGETSPECLEFHHINPKIKHKSISVLLSNGCSEQIYEELKKCEVLCANCHKKITAKQFNWYKQKVI